MTAATNQSAQARRLTPKELAILVKLNREYRQWSQEQLAEVSGLSARTVQRVEEGLASSVDTRRAMARAFEIEDIDAFNKPYEFPTAEQMAAEKERFEKENLTLKAVRIETGKQLAQMAEPTDASMYSETAGLPREVTEVFARLTDYCRDFSESADLYSAVDKLGVYDELNVLVTELHELGCSLVGATRLARAGVLGESKGSPVEVLYVLMCSKGQEPESLAVPKTQRFG